jgi:rhomboid family GlyGly-CTERM serine protease
MRGGVSINTVAQNSWPRKWLLCLCISLCSLTMTWVPHGVAFFRYERLAIASGQAWRLVTAHWVHLNTPHLLMNLAGLFLLSELLWGAFPVFHALSLLLASSVGISALLWWLHPELAWYAGMSGILHALWAACALTGIFRSSDRSALLTAGQSGQFHLSRVVNWIGLLLLIAKLAAEWIYGTSIRTAEVIGAPVVSVAHLYGALIGLGYVLVWRTSIFLRNGNCI